MKFVVPSDCSVNLDLIAIWKCELYSVIYKKLMSSFSGSQIVDCIKGFLNISSDPATFIQVCTSSCSSSGFWEYCLMVFVPSGGSSSNS